MLDFTYQNTVKLIFGRGRCAEAGELAKGFGSRALLVYGGGSIKRSGLYASLSASLKSARLEFFGLGGVQANPTLETALEGIALCRENGIDVILAAGGGSVVDTAKCIAMGCKYDGDVWDFYSKGKIPADALPLITIPTIPAAGSETSINSVITFKGRKLGAMGDAIRPKICIMDPALYMTLPDNQVAYGICDMMSHIFERYFTNTQHTDFTDGLCESVLQTIIKNAPIVMADRENYDAWCQLALCASYAHNGTLGMGRREDWACHKLEHELSAIDDSVPHGGGLAVLTPGWMRYVWRSSPKMFFQFAINVMGVPCCRDESAVVEAGIKALEAFFSSLGLPSRLEQLGVKRDNIPKMAQKCLEATNPLGGLMRLELRDAEAIYYSVY